MSWLGITDEWVIVTTDRNFRRVNNICTEAQRKSHARAISAAPGTGKSVSLKHYSNNNPNAFYIECGDYWTKKVFLSKLKTAMGLKPVHLQGIPDMVDEIIQALRTLRKPLLIIDEADKLKDNTLTFFITFYNELTSVCGFVLSGSEFFEKHIEKFSRLNKKGYREILSRFGGEFLHLYDLTEDRIKAIANANGIHDAERLNRIINKSNGDIRTVQRVIEDIKLLDSKTNE
jgi:DNA transposition AAA+ family ATPase